MVCVAGGTKLSVKGFHPSCGMNIFFYVTIHCGWSTPIVPVQSFHPWYRTWRRNATAQLMPYYIHLENAPWGEISFQRQLSPQAERAPTEAVISEYTATLVEDLVEGIPAGSFSLL